MKRDVAGWTCVLMAIVASSTATHAEPASLSLRVVSFNMWLLPIAAKEVASRRERLGPALAALEPDVLCLQELWDKGAVAALRGTLRPRLPYGEVGGGGLAVASRWPIVDARADAHPHHPSLSLFERLAKKGTLSVVIATPGQLRAR